MKAKSNIASKFSSVKADHIREPLQHAREVGQDHFRRDTQDWAVERWPRLKRATEEIFSTDAIREHGLPNAEAALVGALLGGAVIRAMAEEGAVDFKQCQANMEAWFGPTRGMVYSGNDTAAEGFARLVDEDTATALEEIAHPAARTMCAVVVTMSVISPTEAQQAEVYPESGSAEIT